MAMKNVTAPGNPFANHRKNLEALDKKPVRTPAENDRYIQLLQQEIDMLQEALSMSTP